MTIKNTLNEAIKLLELNKEIMLINIAKSSGSSPRTSDAMMIAYFDENNNKKTLSTIGGGVLEFKVLNDAFTLLQQKANNKKNYSLTNEESGGVGMLCGGNVEIDFRYINKNNKEIIENLIEKENKKNNNVYIFGAGHVSLDLVDILSKLSFNCIIIDDREEFANRFNNAIIVDDYENVFNKINITEKDYIIIVTRGHSYDYIVEKNALKTNAYYIGMIGSSKKIATLHNRLKEEEKYTDEMIERVHAPIGLQIGAESTEEIAVSIAAELILKRAIFENRRKIKKQ
ncbi:xanthine dehydrogenase accessory protein XdhC [uncultured Brachyspira sp.]|uniref:xanthine dehydrogenase accessory protein XdhC n=1 Tax=uncultured Brachyspira sp. TaxID=221953 RepID=UPI0025E0A801|nr:xanthine dehydrogenase accessory protein XdhC [uncultured Brachyspira sp.]